METLIEMPLPFETEKGFSYSIHRNEEWLSIYNKVKCFIEGKGRLPSQNSKDSEERKLFYWITHQKEAKKGKGKNKITEERISLLEALPNWKW